MNIASVRRQSIVVPPAIACKLSVARARDCSLVHAHVTTLAQAAGAVRNRRADQQQLALRAEHHPFRREREPGTVSFRTSAAVVSPAAKERKGSAARVPFSTTVGWGAVGPSVAQAVEPNFSSGGNTQSEHAFAPRHVSCQGRCQFRPLRSTEPACPHGSGHSSYRKRPKELVRKLTALAKSLIASASTIFRTTSSWVATMSVKSRSNRSAQRCPPLSPSTS